MPKSLCEVCLQTFFGGSSDIFQRLHFGSPFVIHHKSESTFQQSSGAGCPVCVVLWRAYRVLVKQNDAIDGEPPRVRHYFFSDVPQETVDRIDRAIEIRVEMEKDPRMKKFVLLPLVAMERQTTRFRVTLTDNTGAPETLDLVQRWLDNCLEHHTICRALSNKHSPFPSRVIDVGTAETDTWRLHIKNDDGRSPGHYATLSHCWGDQLPIMLTTSSMAPMRLGLPFTDLPPTFADAMVVVRRLGLKYLWIDSLCILQDSPEDWAIESSRMGDVYAGAVFNIAATSANDSNSGIFSSRDPDSFSPYTVKAKWNGLEETDYVILDDEPWQGQLNLSPLGQRAWVLQERFLAVRTIHFGCRQLVWQCNSQLACESWPEHVLGPRVAGVGWKVPLYQELVRPDTILHQKVFPDQRSWFKELYNIWILIIRVYSALQLTFPSDKLVALSGVAQMMQGFFDVEYVAGIWRLHNLDEFTAQLLWNVEDGRRPYRYRAPSWSWASVEGRIWMEEVTRDPRYTEQGWLDRVLVQLVNVSVSSNGPDSKGELTGGNLQLRCILFPVLQTDKGSNSCNLSFQGESFKCYMRQDDSKSDLSNSDDLFCLPLSHVRWVSTQVNSLLPGLVIQRTGVQAGSEYTRTGTFTCRSDKFYDLLNLESSESGLAKIPKDVPLHLITIF